MEPPENLDDIPSSLSNVLTDDPNNKTVVSDIIAQYLRNSITYQEASERLESLLGTSEPLKKFGDVLMLNKPVVGSTPPLNDKMPKIPGMRKRSRPWTEDEDHRLTNGVETHGVQNWHLIASLVGNNRTASQCSQRWHRVLDPNIAKTNWSREEEQKLIDLVGKFGTRAWTRISGEMGNRSDVQCRFRYNFLVKKANEKKTEVVPISVPAETLGAAHIDISFNGQQNFNETNQTFQINENNLK